MKPNYTWKELINEANSMGVDLITSYLNVPTGEVDYQVYGVAVSEALVDILT